MMLIVLLMNLFCQANVDSIMKAQTSAQVEQLHQQGVQEQILKQRCDIEVRQSWIPVSCFEWLSQVKPAKLARTQILDFLNRRCLSSLAGDPPMPQKRVFKHILPGRCLDGVHKYYLDQHYKTAAHSTLEDVMKSSDLGKDLVNDYGHEPQNGRKNQQLHTRGTARRRLN